ncbi:hypothetical protein ACFSSC_09435 [Corynebacterium mendelii]|uniref:Uncharacterized protein n=1 Tax=Corynebacterium mendelii TaxID=2765362 RepID=A0A939IY62_9CORY|nr:hypothetical protein [Corynebacterium mendelii]MBN9645200.1 hypothetical protein [Corynebacterium mendelii]
MKKKTAAITACIAVAASCFAPAQAAGFAAKESWTRGAEGVNKFIDSQDCTFMRGHAPMMGYVPGSTFEQAKAAVNANPIIDEYMSRRIDQGAGTRAKMVPPAVRQDLIELGIAGTLKKVADCNLIADPDNTADKEYDAALAKGNAAHTTIDPAGVVAEIPFVIQSFSS